MQAGPAVGLEEQLKCKSLGYRSRGERWIAEALNQYGLPFKYEQPWLIHDRRYWRLWYPDFTLPDHGNQIVEYLGMPENAEYMQRARSKRQIYRENDIRPIFVTPYTFERREWPKRLYERINRRYRSVGPRYR